MGRSGSKGGQGVIGAAVDVPAQAGLLFQPTTPLRLLQSFEHAVKSPLLLPHACANVRMSRRSCREAAGYWLDDPVSMQVQAR
jgi:hypothetical protein